MRSSGPELVPGKDLPPRGLFAFAGLESNPEEEENERGVSFSLPKSSGNQQTFLIRWKVFEAFGPDGLCLNHSTPCVREKQLDVVYR